jgi:DNA polymerase III epsilon subunit-like protein
MMIVGHNMFNFDIPFLTATAQRFGLNLGFRQDEQLDTGLLVKAMQLRMYPGTDERLYNYYRRVGDLRAGVKWSLDRYCIQRFGLDKKHDVDALKAHDAGYDCFLTHLLLKELNAILEGVECRKES